MDNDSGLVGAIERRDELRLLNPHLKVLVSLFYREGPYVSDEGDHRWWELVRPWMMPRFCLPSTAVKDNYQ